MNGAGKAAARADGLRALEGLLAAYGADPARWPAADRRRAAAWTLIESGDAAALEAVAAARALDRSLDRALGAAPAPSAALTGAVLRGAQQSRRSGRSASVFNLALFRPAGALACAMLLGIAVGIWSPVPVVGIGESRAAGPDTELAALGALHDSDDNGDGFGDFAR